MQTRSSAAQFINFSNNNAIRIAAAAMLVATADAFFYGREVGISLFAFLVLLAVCVSFCNRLRAEGGEFYAAAAVLALALVPIVEVIDPLSAAFAFAGLAAFALIVTGNARTTWPEFGRRVVLLLSGNMGEARRRFDRWRLRRSRGFLQVSALLSAWLIPLALGSVFVTLFSIANPVFWSWVKLVDIWGLVAALEPLRFSFWAIVGFFVWSFLRMKRFVPAKRAGAASAAANSPGLTMGKALVVRSLAVFNVIFALQTVLDGVYLWGGLELPEGVSPAASAQKAAYILVVTALLAAGFVLAALRKSAEARPSRLVRALICLWIVQNVVLILSAILRLNLYVEIYSLTRLRFAAFVWMGLVAAGLVLIILRIVLARSNEWLIKANLVSLCVALYACVLLDVNAIIANYNVSQSREISGHGVFLDRRYLCKLGPSALGAILRFQAEQAVSSGQPGKRDILENCAQDLRRTIEAGYGDWRAWTFREHRIRVQMAARDSQLREGAERGSEDTGRR